MNANPRHDALLVFMPSGKRGRFPLGTPILQAARNLGASPWTCFRTVTLPLAAPGLMASAIFVFLESLDEFTGTFFVGVPDVITLPHLGASTREAEDNCAVMVVDQVRDFLENGNILNAVNFPDVVMAREAPFRVGIANANVPNMVGQISTAMAKAGLNIHNMINKSRDEMAYTLVDVDTKVPVKLIEQIGRIEGVLAVRYLPVDH